jgi:hypothetical protein
VEVHVSEPAKEYIQRHGGTIFVRPHSHRCCSGSLTLLDSTTTPPRDAVDFTSYDTEGVDVQFCGSPSGLPRQLIIELRGVFLRRPIALWEGCAFKP